jgi:uncharacterized protein YfaT (DUF1175 family)
LPRHFARRLSVPLVCLLMGLALAASCYRDRKSELIISPDRAALPANGYAETKINILAGNHHPTALVWTVAPNPNLADIEMKGSEVYLRAGVNPGEVTLVARASGFTSARANIQLNLDPTDQFGDGTPDFLRLDNEEDRAAFRYWFALLAESTYFEAANERPSEVSDCAALIRFAYRESLRKHDASWANQWHLPQSPSTSSVKKYEYPHTALAAGLFRTKPGAFAPDDIANGTFAQFADAESLRRYNTHFVSRQLNAARPGDLLFFRQEGHKMPFHTMIYVGNSYFTDGTDWIIYHTGPNDDGWGEIRRVTATELQHHPEFCWRPLPQNPAFLGVYRWNILREED